mgnify:CR=1 FL=1
MWEELKEDDEDAEDDEENELHISMQGSSSKSDMSLEEARYTLQHIKSEALIDEDSKKSIKPPYRFYITLIYIYTRLYYLNQNWVDYFLGTYNLFVLH